ncbi:MAG: hypothetical protein KDA68_20095 [Planctomycetaceae bacterium]|nr:hypothetical protein [Planctomycetaceae bacterium]
MNLDSTEGGKLVGYRKNYHNRKLLRTHVRGWISFCNNHREAKRELPNRVIYQDSTGFKGQTMTLKRVLILTGAWTLVMVGVCVVAIWYVVTHRVPGVRPEERASQLGSGLGLLTTFGYALIWLPFAAKVGKQRRAEREAQTRRKKQKPKR